MVHIPLKRNVVPYLSNTGVGVVRFSSIGNPSDVASALTKHEFLVLIRELRDTTTRSTALDRLISSNEYKFTDADCKTLLVAAVETRSVTLTARLLKRFKNEFKLTAELLYVGIRTACRKNVWPISYLLLLEAHADKISVDIDTVNTVIHTLTKHGRLTEAWTILEKIHNLQFGNDVIPDVLTYSMVIGCAGREKRRELMMEGFQMLASNPQVEPDEQTYVVALHTCSFTGDFIGAMEIFSLYKKSFKILHPRAYSLLLIAFVTSPRINQSSSSSTTLSSTLKNLYIELDIIVNNILELNLQTDITISNLILQYYSVCDDAQRAYSYFQFMQDTNIRPSTTALMEYSSCICRVQGYIQANYLYDYMLSQGLLPFSSLSRLCLDRACQAGDIDRALQLLQSTISRYLSPSTSISTSTKSGYSQPFQFEWFHSLILLSLDKGRYSDAITVFQSLSYALQQGSGSMSVDFMMLLSIIEHLSTRLPLSVLPLALE
eukprot:gene502-956_t